MNSVEIKLLLMFNKTRWLLNERKKTQRKEISFLAPLDPPLPPRPPPQRNYKNTHFVNMISEVLGDLVCSLNQSLKSCDDYYNGTLKTIILRYE